MQNATKSTPSRTPRTSVDLSDLALALRDVVRAIRSTGPGDHRDKAAVGLLAHLAELGPVRVSDLAEHACLSPSTVSRHLTEMEEAGYLVRVPDDDDKRAVVLEISVSGRALVAATKASRLETLERAVETWTPEDIATMSALMRRLATNLENR